MVFGGTDVEGDEELVGDVELALDVVGFVVDGLGLAVVVLGLAVVGLGVAAAAAAGPGM